MMISPIVLLGALRLVSPLAESEVLQRVGDWGIENDGEACHLYSQYGSGNALVVARISQYAPGDSFALALFGKRFRAVGVEEVALDFGLGGKPAAKWALPGQAGGYPGILFGGVRIDGFGVRLPDQPGPAITIEQEARVTGVTVPIRGLPAFRLNFGSMGKPFSTLRDCLKGLVRSWGYDPEAQASLSRPVTPATSPREWVTNMDYPEAALKAGISGAIHFRLAVDAEGKITDCHIAGRTSPDVFGTKTCQLLNRRARFQPALDANGKPTASYFASTFNYFLPGRR